jgi:peroxiredoxin Q/BCP
MLELGQEAPDFELPSSEMRMVRLSEFRGDKQVVLYFYPKDDTPGCTIESQEFSDLQEEFEKLDTVVIGISRDNCMSHGEFRDKYGLTVQLLADVEGAASNDYGVLQQREKDGVMKEVAVRSTFIIDKDGILELAQDILDILSES